MHAALQDLPMVFVQGKAALRTAEWGDMAVTLYTMPGGLDLTQLLAGLPDNRCQCPHWGYVLRGQIRVKYADHDERFHAGEVFHITPGHAPVFEDDTEMVEFSPKEEFRAVLEMVSHNLNAMLRSRQA